MRRVVGDAIAVVESLVLKEGDLAQLRLAKGRAAGAGHVRRHAARFRGGLGIFARAGQRLGAALIDAHDVQAQRRVAARRAGASVAEQRAADEKQAYELVLVQGNDQLNVLLE